MTNQLKQSKGTLLDEDAIVKCSTRRSCHHP